MIFFVSSFWKEFVKKMLADREMDLLCLRDITDVIKN